jgi:hypothetical protein
MCWWVDVLMCWWAGPIRFWQSGPQAFGWAHAEAQPSPPNSFSTIPLLHFSTKKGYWLKIDWDWGLSRRGMIMIIAKSADNLNLAIFAPFAGDKKMNSAKGLPDLPGFAVGQSIRAGFETCQ